MAVSKKGFLFTTLALVLVAVIIIVAASEERLFPRTQAQMSRIDSMNTYLLNLQRDLPQAAYIAGFRSLIGLEEHISGTGVYLTEFNTSFASMFTNGTLNSTYYSIMDNSTFTDFAQRFDSLAGEQGMTSALTVEEVQAYQLSPWEITLNITVGVVLSDTANTARFNRTETVTTSIPIESIKDPLYTIGTQGRAPHTVAKSNITEYITPANDTTGLETFINSTLYRESGSAPSFLQRFTGDFSASPYGIESLVSIAELRAQDLSLHTCTSIVDYLYFQDIDTTPNSYIVNTDNDDVWLDDAHLADFDATAKTTGVRPCP